MALKYGLDILTPSTNPKEEPWKAIMLNKVARRLWASDLDAVDTMDQMKRGNPHLQIRVVEVHTDDPTYSV